MASFRPDVQESRPTGPVSVLQLHDRHDPFSGAFLPGRAGESGLVAVAALRIFCLRILGPACEYELLARAAARVLPDTAPR